MTTSAQLRPTTPSLLSRDALIAILALTAIAAHIVMRWFAPENVHQWANIPLYIALIGGGIPLVWDLASHALRGEFGADLIAGISIITAAILEEYLAGTLVVLMLSGGGTLENYAVRSASSVLDVLAKRMPTTAHKKVNSRIVQVPLDDVQVNDVLVILPHEVCPADGTVLEGHGSMDESYLTGEPYILSKTPGAAVLSGAINGEAALTIRADRRPIDSRYAKIMEVMEQSAQQRPKMRRLADRLGAIYTPIAVIIALIAWGISGDPVRFLAVLVVATPCPLLIAIPVAIIGSISLAAKRSIIIRDPAALERMPSCRTMILDKTGTLTYGKPQLVEQIVTPGFDPDEVLALTASLEQYSKHPLATAVLDAAHQQSIAPREAANISEPPGQGLRGRIGDKSVRITSRTKLLAEQPDLASALPKAQTGLECVVLIDDQFAALYQFRDAPRKESRAFISHLGPRHGIENLLLVSGDRESEVKYLAEQVGIEQVYANQSPEKKVQIVREQNKLGPTIFVGDGINDAPALMTATVGVALGTQSDVTVEAAGAVILDNSLERVDELMHISKRMRRIALQSAVGGMALSIIGMFVAAAGYLPPVAGAITQEAIDIIVIVNALRVAVRPKSLTDF